MSMQREEHFSAGGVVYRVVDGVLEIVLCGRDKPLLWCLPKGTPEAGETIEETALREVREETGLEVTLENDLGEIEYWFKRPGSRVHKRVNFFLMSPIGGNTDDHDPEFDRVRWFNHEEAIKAMTHETEVRLVRKTIRQIQLL